MKKIYKLKSNLYEVHVIPKYGMNCTKIVCTNPSIDILKTPPNVDMLENDDAFLFGTPILFFPNRISNGCFIFENREYRFPINEVELNNFCHGTLHKLPFEVLECDNRHIKGVFIATTAKPYLTFPHSFEFYMEYKLKEDGVHQIVSIKNTSSNNMPVALGFHTTFNLSYGIKVKIPVEKYVERSMDTFLPTGKISDKFDIKQQLNDGTFDPYDKPISKLFELNNKTIQICNPESKAVISYIYDEKYRYCMLYSSNGKDHICIEPQTWITNCPNLDIDRDKFGFDFIKPGDTKIFSSVISATTI